MHSRLNLVCVLLTTPAFAAPFTEDFESIDPGSFPASPWRDIATAAIPSPAAPTGQVIDTLGIGGTTTRAFQIHQRSTTSQGIIADISHSVTHRIEADLRVDIHPTPVRYGDWTAAMGFFNQQDAGADINTQPQGVVYVYRSRWYFYAAVSPANFMNIELAAMPVVAGEWYHVSLAADTSTGMFAVAVRDDMGGELLSRSLTLSTPNLDLLAFNRVAVFDGEYSGRAATPGQFTADNITYVPAPAAATLLLAPMTLLARRRRV